MPTGTWENLIGAEIEGRYRLRSLTHSGRDQAEFLAEAAASNRSEPVTITLIAAGPDEIDDLRSQMQIASRLRHPNLVHIFSAGESAIEGRFMLYLASETVEETLAHATAEGPLPEDAVRALLLDIVEALHFLHEEGLVYRSLEPRTIVRVNGHWKLADYGQVCPVLEFGKPDPPPHSSPYLPPEARTGPVLPGWDMWSLGILLREVLTGRLDESGKIPRRFAGIIQGCLQAHPRRRLAAQQIRLMLAPRPVPSGQTDMVEAPGAPAAVSVRSEAEDAGEPAAAESRAVTWSPLRLAALISIACLAVLLSFLWRRSSARPAAPGVQASAPRAASAKPPAAKTAARAPAATRPAPMPARTAAVARPALRQATPATDNSAAAPRGETGRADYISSKMNGRITASGEPFNSNAMTAAHRTYHMGTRLRVTNLKTNRSVIVRVNDRSPARRGHVIGLSERAARELGITRDGSAQVRVETVE